MSKEFDGLLTYIFRYEAEGDYNAVNNDIPEHLRPPKPVTEMTVQEVLDWQRKIDPFVNSEAAGALQIMPDTLAEEIGRGTVKRTDLFDADAQRKLAISRMQFRGLDDWQAGRLSTEDFGTNLAMEWAALPVLKDTYNKGTFVPAGNGYYGGDGINPSKVAANMRDFATVLGDPGRVLTVTTPRGSRAGSTPRESRAGSTPRYTAQNQPVFGADPLVHMRPWEAPDVDLSPRYENTVDGAADDVIPASTPSAPPPDYKTRTGAGGGPVLGEGFIGGFVSGVADGYISRQMAENLAASNYKWDSEFDPVTRIVSEGREKHLSYLSRAKNAEHYQYLLGQIERAERQSRRDAVTTQSWGGSIGNFLGYTLNPDSVVSLVLPGGIMASAWRRSSVNVLRSGASVGAIAGASEAAFEYGRAPLDPMSTPLDSFTRVAGATIFAGVLGGVIGGVSGVRARGKLATEIGDEIAVARGVGTVTDEVELNGGVKGHVTADPSKIGPEIAPILAKRGVAIVGDEVIVDAEALMKRFAAGDVPDGIKSANELMEYEVNFTAALSRMSKEAIRKFIQDESGAVKMGPNGPKGFAKVSDDGVFTVDRDGLEEVVAKGGKIPLGPPVNHPHQRIKPVMVDSRVLKSLDEAEEIVREAAKAATHARDNQEFREMVGAIFTRRMKRLEDAEPADVKAARAKAEADAEIEAEKAVEAFRKKNNRILKDARTEALARLMDSPYKRIHRNGLSPETRDLADLLAADGGFARGSDGTGATIGPSVYSRGKTWDGIVRKLWDRETELYEQYLGFASNPSVADIPVNKSFRKKRSDGSRAIPVEEFRRRASYAYITGRRDSINEINEMVENLRAGWLEYKTVAEEYGVLSSLENLRARRSALKERLDELDPEGKDFADLKVSLDEVDREMKLAGKEPSEDYFTRVYSQRTIRDNREAFKERVVKPWMRQQPWVDVWQEGYEELGKKIKEIKASGADINDPRFQRLRSAHANASREGRRYSSWQRVEASDDPALLDKRAEEIIDNILQEAEPENLGILREPNRPSFGRTRQFDIPNRMLLKGGPLGNGIADFIETDYLLLHKIYSDRMGPAIEMARTFARPADGVAAREGFAEAMESAWQAERKAHKGTDEVFNEHWAPIERDLLHLKDRVTNRIVHNPERWDNRVATALRNWSHLAFMGMSALPAVQELGTLVMRHGVSRTFHAAFHDLDTAMGQAMKAGVIEGRKAGAILDVAMGSALARFAETGFDASTGTAVERWLRTGANKYFLWNGLAPLTTRLKEIDLSLRVHDTVERVDRVGMGVATEADFKELNRFGISRADAEAMAKEPIYRSDEGHWFANTDDWGNEDLVRKFRAAIRQGNENTILLATAADKPTIVDGVMYIRKSRRANKYAARLGLEEAGDYWRVHSGLMSLPFTFWNYTIAATNKIMLAGLDEPSAQKLGGIAAIVGLGYMVASMRTNESAWAEMPFQDRLARAIDQSGVMGVIPQYAHLLQGTAIGLTGRNPMPFDPRHGHHPDMLDAAFNLAGAGPSVARNAVQGVLTGDANRTSWALPLRNHFALKWLFDAAVDGVERNRQGLD